MDPNKQRIILSLANDLKSGDPMRVKYATEFKNSMIENYKLTGEKPNFNAIASNLDKPTFSDMFDSKKLVQNWNKISAPKSTLIKEKFVSYGDEKFVGPPSPKYLEEYPNFDFLQYKANKDMRNAISDGPDAEGSQSNFLAAQKTFNNAINLKTKINLFNENFDKLNDQQKEDEARKITNIVRNLKWDNVQEVKAFQERLSEDATNKVLQKYNVTKDALYKMHKDYLKLSPDQKKKSAFRNILVDAGLEFSKYDENSPLYNRDQRNLFTKNKNVFDNDPEMVSNMAIAGEKILGKIYSDKQKVDITALDSFEKDLSDIRESITAINNEYATKSANIVKQLNAIGSKKYSNVAEYNVAKRTYDGLLNQLNGLEAQAKAKTDDSYKKHREVYSLYKNKLSEIQEDSDNFVKQTQDYVNDYDFATKNHDDWSKKQVRDIIGSKYYTGREETVVRALYNTAESVIGNIYTLGQLALGATGYIPKDVANYNILSAKANAYNQGLSWNTGQFDKDGNPVTTKTIKWTDKNGDWHLNPSGIIEAGVETGVHMYLTSLATKGLAAATAATTNAIGNLGVKAFNGIYGTSKFSKLALKADDVLKTSVNVPVIGKFNIGARALTYPAVFLTTYGKILSENVGKFKTMDEARDYALNMTNFEALTESIVPDVFFFSKKLWSPKIGTVLSAKQLDNVANFFRTSGKLTGKEALKEFGKVAGKTLSISGLDLAQEAIVEEELNFYLQSNYEDNQIAEKGISEYVRQGEKFGSESARNLGIESLLTMSITSALGLKGAYKQAKMQNLAGLADPKYMSYHRFNIAANANQVRERIANDNTLNSEQKANAFNTIAEYEGLLKTAASAIKKPSKKTLGNDEDTLFAYFKALSDKTNLESKIFDGTVSEEEKKTYENADEILKRIDTENADWAKLTPEQKQDQWFKWYEEGIMNTSQMGLENSPFLQTMSLTQRQEAVEKLYKKNIINDEMYNRYKQSFENSQKAITKNSIKNIESNLKNVDNLSLNQLAILRHDLMTAIAANNDSIVTGYNYGEVIVPTGLEANGDTEAFKKRLVETADLGDKIQVTYLDIDNNTKNATLAVTENGLVIEGTNKRLTDADEIISAKIGKPILSENEQFRKNKAKYQELSTTIANATIKEIENFKKVYSSEIGKIEENRIAETNSIKQVTGKNGAVSFEYQSKDLVTGDVVNRTAATRQQAEADIKLRHDSALRQLQSKKTEVAPLVDATPEQVVAESEIKPIVLNLEQDEEEVKQAETQTTETQPEVAAAEEVTLTIDSILNTEEESSVLLKNKRKAMIQNYIDGIEDIDAEIEALNDYKNDTELAEDQVVVLNSIINKLRDKKVPAAKAAAETTPASDIEAKKADIEKTILGSFTNTTEKVVNSKGPNNGRTIKTELTSKISSDGEVIVFKSKNTFADNGDSLVAPPASMTIEEFKEHFYPMLTADQIEMFEETLEVYKEEGWKGKIYFKELRVGSSKATNLKGQIDLDIMIGMGGDYAFTLTKKLTDAELAALEGTQPAEETLRATTPVGDILTEASGEKGSPTADDVAEEAASNPINVNTTEDDEDADSADIFVQSYVPVSPFITISDEVSRTGQINNDPYTAPINAFIKNLGEEISNYKGELISMERFLTEQGVDIQAVKDKIAEYWKAAEKAGIERRRQEEKDALSTIGSTLSMEELSERAKEIDARYDVELNEFNKEYIDFLNTQLGGKIKMDTIKWLLTNESTEKIKIEETEKERIADNSIREGSMNDRVYGIKKSQDKFTNMTLKSFVFLLTDKEGKPIVINSKGKRVPNGVVDGSGNMFVTRALPKIKLENGEYSFYNITTFESPEFVAQMPDMYDIQQQFLSGKIDKMPVSNMSVSNGFFKDEYNQSAPKGKITIQLIAVPGSNLQNGRAYDEKGRVVYTTKLKEEDLEVVATMLSQKGITPEQMKEQNRYINSIVFLTDDQKRSLRGKSVSDIKKALKGKHYNISNTIISGNNTIQLYKVEDGKLVSNGTAIYDSFMKDKWYTIEFKHKEGQNKKIYFTIEQKNEPTDVPFLSPEDMEDDEPWLYSKTNAPARVTAEEELKAYSWFMRSFLSNGIGFNYSFLSHPEAFATFTNAAISLFEGSNFTDLYHEAWHRFSQHFLTVEEKEALYQEAKSLFAKGELTDSELKAIEESLAEGFRSLAKSDGKIITLTYAGKTIKIDVNNPKANQKKFANIFQKYWNFLKSLFTNKKGEKLTAEQLISKYMKEAYSERTSRMPNVTNSLFKEPLNVAKQRVFTVMDDGEEKQVVIDYSSLYELSQGIDYLFVSYFNQIPRFKKVNASFTAFSSQPEAQRNMVASQIYSKVLDHIKELEADETNPNRKIQYKAVINNFKFFVEETQGMRKAFTNANIQTAEELTNNLEDSETKLETADVYETKVSQQNLSSNAIIDLITMIPKVDKNGNLYKGSTWGLPEMAPFGSTWAAIANNLTGLTYPEMISKLESMSRGKYPQMKYLLENLPPADLNVSAPLSTQQLKVEFEQIFNMPKVTEMITEMGSEAGDFVVRVFEAGTSASRNVIDTWKNDAVEVDLTAVFNSHPKVVSVEQKLAFLNDIGIAFTNQEELMKLLEKPARKNQFDTAFTYIYNQLKKVNQSKKVIPNTVDLINMGVPSSNIKPESFSLKVLSNLEIDSNEDIIDDMILKANGTTDWKFKQFNYILKMSNSLNSMTYDQLKAIYPQFDIVKNPSIRNSVWFNHLFNIDSDGTVVRNKKNALEFLRMGGLQSDKFKDGGKVIVDLSASDKLVTDFYSFIESGLEENVRFGDKSTAGAIKLTNIERIPVGDTGKIINNLYQLMLGELATIGHIKSLEDTLPSNSKQYKNRKETFVFFKSMLPKELQDELLQTTLVLEENKWTIKDEGLENAVKQSISEYFNKVVFEGMPATETTEAVPSFKQLLIDAMGNNLQAVMPKVKTNGVDRATYTVDELALWYYMYSVSNRIDQFNMIYGDPRNYKNGSDIYKRLSAYSATGKFPVLNESDMLRLNKDGRALENLYATDGITRKFTSKFNIVQFADVAVNLSEDYLSKDMPEDLQKAWSDYIKKEGEKDKGERTDASGAVTLDFYRALNILIGTWLPDQEQAFLDQVEFVKAKMELEKTESARERYNEARTKAKASYSDLLVVFNPKKWQYAGSIYSTHTPAANMDMRAFLKFSIMPLIPSNIENTELEKVVENMYKTKTDLYLFQSGSKMSMDQENQKFNNWSSDKTPKFNPTVLDLYNFKEQLPIENKMKDEAIFASQMRKLLSVGIYENGKAVRNDAEYQKYVKAVKNITDLLKVEVEGKIDTPKKIVEYLVREFDKRDMPENVKDFLNFFEAENQLVDTLDLSLQTSFIQNALFSIINNKLIRQKYTGGQYIQAPNIGFRSANFKETALYRDDDLKFYETAPGKDTRSMEVKIAFSPKYKGLLNLIHPDGKRIGTLDKLDDALDRLNDALRNEKFIEENAAKFTLVGCRIPVQGFSTIESMRVAEFLDPIAGQIIIVPNGLTIKSGSDFDIDKLNVYEPHVDAYGNLIEESYDSIEDYKETVEMEEELQSEIDSLKQDLIDIKATYIGTDRLYEIDSMISDIERSESEEALFAIAGKINLEDLKERFKNQKASPIADLKKERKEIFESEAEGRKMYYDTLDKISNKVSLIREFRNYRNNLLSSEINKLIGSVSNIVLDKDNAVNLMTKNELDYMESAYQAMGIPSKDESSMGLSDAVDVIASNKVFGINTDAKRMLGIAAKSNTLYALFMETGMKLTTEVASMLPQNTIDDVTSLSNLYTQPYSGTNKDKYSKFGNTEAMYIPKLLSELISASVDVANDNRIGDPVLNINKFTMPMLIWNTMKGTHLFDTLDILSDPRVIEFVKQYVKRNSIAYKHYLTTTIKNEKAVKVELNKYRFVKTTVESLVTKENIVKEFSMKLGFRVMHIQKTIAKQLKNNPEVKTNTLLEFISMMENGNKLTELSSATSWDTNSSNSFIEFAYTDRQLEKIVKEQFFNPKAIVKLRGDSVIAGLDVSDFVADKFSNLFSIISSDEFISQALDLYSYTTGVDLKDFSRDFTNDFLTYLYQNNATLGDKKAYPALMPVLLKDNPNNIEKRFKDVISSIKNPAILANSFVNNLKFNKSRDSRYIDVVLKNPNMTTPEINALNNDLLKLLNSTYSTNAELNDTISNVTKLLIMSTLLKNGLNKTFGSFISIIPTDLYTEVLRDVVAKGITEDMYKEFTNRFMNIRKGKYFEYSNLPGVPYDRNNRFNYFISQEKPVSLQEPSVEDLGLNTDLSQENFKC